MILRQKAIEYQRPHPAAFGTALVTAVLFAALSLKGPEAARLFAIMAQNTTGVAPDLPAAPEPILADIADAFRVAFFSIAVFTAAVLCLALSIPLRRI
jgi:hypothetical protein